MDKKNVMLLTVIAVATLLVAVVGATFAYFSLTNTNNGGTTTATTTTEQMGTITLSDGEEDLHLKLTAANMAEAKAGQKYFAVKDTEGTPSTTSVKANVVKASIAGGSNTATYTCNGKLNVKVTGTDITASELSGKVTLTADAKTTITGGEVSLTDAAATNGVDVTYVMTAIKNDTATTPEKIYADMYFENTSSTQNSLAGKTITATIESTEFSCTVDQPTT